MKFQISVFLTSLLLLTACGSSKHHASAPLHAQRYDPVNRTWVSLSAPTVRQASRAPERLAPENATATAKVIETVAPAQPATPQVAINPSPEDAGLLKRMGRAATSPLRMVGIGKD